ncbi:MAG: urease accessory UreF family protein, partial [Betaproteobacteria bacterium]
AQVAWSDRDHALVAELNAGFIATREASELRAETTQMGYSLLRWCDDSMVIDDDWRRRLHEIEAPAYPIVFAAIACAWGLDTRSALTAYLWTWLENQVSAALKAVPLGQTDGQRILLAGGPILGPLVDAAIDLAAVQPHGGWPSQCPGLAIASSCHETQYSRLFRS